MCNAVFTMLAKLVQWDTKRLLFFLPDFYLPSYGPKSLVHVHSTHISYLNLSKLLLHVICLIFLPLLRMQAP